MVASILNLFANMFGAIMSWFDSLINSMGAGSFILAGFAIFFAVTFLIRPLRGGGMSDGVLSKGKSDKASSVDDSEG